MLVGDLPSPLGVLRYRVDAGAVVGLDLVGASTSVPAACDASDPLDAVIAALLGEQLTEYFDGRRQQFTVPLRTAGTVFQQRAWEVLRTIPFGSVISYGEQARLLGQPRAARAVGAANGRNPVLLLTPCHRVVGADGSLTGFSSGLATKTWLLDHERQVLHR